MNDDHFPERGRSEEKIISEVEAAKEEDLNFSSGRVFGSMCTEPLKIGKEVYCEFLEANLGNPGLCKGTQMLEGKVHRAVGSLINAAKEHDVLSVGGGTEGNIIALWRARNESGKRKVILPKSAHFSFEKACSLLDMEPNYVPLNDSYLPDLSVMEEKIDDDTAIIVGVAGTTELGLVEPIEKIAEISGEIPLHVDAAFGGFVIPFLKELGHDIGPFSFDIDGVDSLVLDPHKMGMSPTPLGLFYSRADPIITVESPYLSAKEQKTIRGTRASASIPAFWATLNYLGREGYRNIVADCMENTHYLMKRLKEVGLEPIIEPVMNIASFHHDEPERIVSSLETGGWNISRTTDPSGLRFVIMPHVTEEAIDDLSEELGDYI